MCFCWSAGAIYYSRSTGRYLRAPGRRIHSWNHARRGHELGRHRMGGYQTDLKCYNEQSTTNESISLHSCFRRQIQKFRDIDIDLKLLY